MSDSNMTGHEGIVIGTAGHIDHGKTSLVRKLTGIDTDRLEEEKRRGISIDLGYAHLALPSGRRVSLVDVPGHERFIRNMLAGAAGIEAVLLIVAADESVKPQTREHFEICRLLGIERGIIVLTKADLASEGQIAAARESLDRLRAGSFLAQAPVLTTSAATGYGIDQLIQALEQLAETKTSREREGLVRLPLDRSFALKGFGTVVTGTLWSGTLGVGDTLELKPLNRTVRVRGLQVHGDPATLVRAGQRTAVNLSGIDHASVRRGFVLAQPDSLETTRHFHASIDWLGDGVVPDRREDFLLHIGTAEVTAHVKVLGSSGENARSFAQLTVADPVLALPGDRFVLRRPSPSQTVGGGSVIDPFPPRRLNRAKTCARLARLTRAALAGRLELLVGEKENGCWLAELVRLTGRSAGEIKAAVHESAELKLIEPAQRVISERWLARRRELLLEWLRQFHLANPSLAGAPVAQARLGLDTTLSSFVFNNCSDIRITGDLVALSTHRAQASSKETEALLRIEQAVLGFGYQPPSEAEILKSAAPDPKSARTLLEKLIKSGRLVRVSGDLLFHADVIAHMRRSLSAHKGRRFSIPEFKEWTHVSRKYAVPLLEYLDRQRVTRRDGDYRIVL